MEGIYTMPFGELPKLEDTYQEGRESTSNNPKNKRRKLLPMGFWNEDKKLLEILKDSGADEKEKEEAFTKLIGKRKSWMEGLIQWHLSNMDKEERDDVFWDICMAIWEKPADFLEKGFKQQVRYEVKRRKVSQNVDSNPDF